MNQEVISQYNEIDNQLFPAVPNGNRVNSKKASKRYES